MKFLFLWAKEVLGGEQVLIHYDPQKPLILSVDASPYGIGAILSHLMENGSEWPVEFAPRTRSGAERNYTQIEKKGWLSSLELKYFSSTCMVEGLH